AASLRREECSQRRAPALNADRDAIKSRPTPEPDNPPRCGGGSEWQENQNAAQACPAVALRRTVKTGCLRARRIARRRARVHRAKPIQLCTSSPRRLLWRRERSCTKENAALR